MLLAFNLPASAPWWIAMVGSVIAIVLVKQMFGGMGVGVAFLDLDENDLGAVPHDQINFPRRPAPAPRGNLAPCAQIDTLDTAFGRLAGLMRQFARDRPHHSSASFNAR